MENRFRCVRIREVKLPHRANEGDAGLDFYFPTNLTVKDLKEVASNAHLNYTYPYSPRIDQFTAEIDHKTGYIGSLYLGPKTRIAIPSGIRALLEPQNSMMQVNNKSGRASKQGLIFTAQVCDSPYTGEYHLCVFNSSPQIQILHADQAIVQLVHIPIFITEPEEITLDEYDEIAQTWGTRQSNGMGESSNDL